VGKTVIIYFKALSRISLGGNEDNYQKPQQCQSVIATGIQTTCLP